ncbi:MAG: hypothetical protein RLZZ23_2058 [Verrucomicrobiota bacterium]
MSLTVEIVTPDRRAYEGTADKVTLPTAMGSIGILPGHQPITAIIAAGEVILTIDGKISRLAIDQGFVRVVSDGQKDIDPVEIAKMEQILRFALVQRLVKGRTSQGMTE